MLRRAPRRSARHAPCQTATNRDIRANSLLICGHSQLKLATSPISTERTRIACRDPSGPCPLDVRFCWTRLPPLSECSSGFARSLSSSAVKLDFDKRVRLNLRRPIHPTVRPRPYVRLSVRQWWWRRRLSSRRRHQRWAKTEEGTLARPRPPSVRGGTARIGQREPTPLHSASAG